MSDTVSKMLNNAQAESWADVRQDYVFDSDMASPLDRLESYVDYCFETYDVVSENLSRSQIQCCVADWGRRRGQCKYNARMDQQTYGKRVSDSAHRIRKEHHYAVFVATALVGIKPEDDKGVGWKPCVRHELGHAIDYEQRGASDHGHKFKRVMQQFGKGVNDGQHAHGWAPRVHR